MIYISKGEACLLLFSQSEPAAVNQRFSEGTLVLGNTAFTFEPGCSVEGLDVLVGSYSH